jgi:hypothetical protein
MVKGVTRSCSARSTHVTWQVKTFFFLWVRLSLPEEYDPAWRTSHVSRRKLSILFTYRNVIRKSQLCNFQSHHCHQLYTVSSHCCESQYWNPADYMGKLELGVAKVSVVVHSIWIIKGHHMGTKTCVSMPRQLQCIDGVTEQVRDHQAL